MLDLGEGGPPPLQLRPLHLDQHLHPGQEGDQGPLQGSPGRLLLPPARGQASALAATETAPGVPGLKALARSTRSA